MEKKYDKLIARIDLGEKKFFYFLPFLLSSVYKDEIKFYFKISLQKL